MPRLTAKYRAALETVRALRWDDSGTQEELYARLEERLFAWDSKTKKWQELGKLPADPPTPLVMVRVWAETGKVEAAADTVQRAYEVMGYRLVERSRAYVCRPPKQLESRVYLKFLPEG